MTTSAEIIYQRRLRVLDQAKKLGNVSEACRRNGVSRTRYYQWRATADRYGLDALWPKDRRRARQPNETPNLVIQDLLTVVVIEPTIGCRQYADQLSELGYDISKSTVQRILVTHGLGSRHQRVAQAAAIAALSGLVTEPAQTEV